MNECEPDLPPWLSACEALDSADACAALPPAARDAAWMRLERMKRQLTAVQARMIATTSASHSFDSDGHRTPRAWIAAIANQHIRTAGHHVRRAALLAALPVLRVACIAGDIGDDQLALLTTLHHHPRCGHLLRESDELLTAHARELAYPDFAAVCARWLAHADPDGAHRDHTAARNGRSVSYRRHGHGFELHIRGDALTGDLLTNILDAHTEAERLTDLAASSPDEPLARTAAQRRFDAVTVIFRKAASTTDIAELQVDVVIHTTRHTLDNAIRTFFGRPTVPDHPSQRLELCETNSGAPVDPIDLAIAALTGRIEHIVSDPTGRPIHLGRRSRLFTGAARRAVLLMNDRCIHPGCHIQGGHIQLDHVHPWPRGGLTDPENAAPMCGPHNRHKHVHHITCRQDQTGWHHYRPDGTEIAPRTG